MRAEVTALQGFVTLVENDQLILYNITMDTRYLTSANIVIQRHIP